MSKQQTPLQKLFTFGSAQLSQCLKHSSKQQLNKFPFKRSGKFKKMSNYQKIVSQQRQTIKNKGQQNISQQNIIPVRQRVSSCLQTNNNVIELGIKHGISQLDRFHSCQKKKNSLPKIFRNLGARNSSSNRKKISSQGYLRYQADQTSDLNESQSSIGYRLGANSEKRPKSMMFISQNPNQLYRQKLDQKLKHNTIPQKKNIRTHKLATDMKPIMLIDDKILENIKQLKQIYQ